MKKLIITSVSLLLGGIACGAFADTQEVSNTAYQVTTDEGEMISLPDGRRGER
jgi:hypothetical protein